MARSLHAAGHFGAAVCVAGAFYLLLIDLTTVPELAAAAAATLLAAVATEAARRNGLRGVAARPAWLVRGARAVARVPPDIARVCCVALGQLVSPRPARGCMRAIPFRYGDSEDSHDMGRRALAEALGTLAPNTIVIGIDEEHDLLLVHQLQRSGGRGAIDVAELG